MTIKYNSDGELIWVARYSSPGLTGDWGSDVTCDNDGNVYVTGYSGNLPQRYPITIKYDANGAQIWAVKDTINGWMVSVGLDNENNVYVTGYQIVRDSARYSIIKYNPDGVLQWRAGDNIIGYPFKLKVSPDGDVVVTGAAGLGFTGDWRWDIVTAKYNTFGQEKWVQRNDGPAGGWDEGHSLAFDDQRNVYVTGSSGTQPSGAPAFDYVTIKYSSSGSEEWVRRYGFEGDDESYDIAVDTQNNVYVGGYSFGLNNNRWNANATMVKYDSSGQEVWVARYNGSDSSASGILGLALDEQGDIYVTGWTYYHPAANYDYLTIKYPPTGPGVLEDQKYDNEHSQITITPNPFQRLVRLEFKASDISSLKNIKIYDIGGRLMKEFKQVTTPSIVWNCKDDNNNCLPTGIYLLQFKTITKKLILMR